jgi:hypothetical protein
VLSRFESARLDTKAAITARKISITFHVRQYGGSEWWLTRESGHHPPCASDSCFSHCPDQQRGDYRQSYLVIVIDHPGDRVWTEPVRRVAFAQLNTDALSIVACRIAPTLLGHDVQHRLPVVKTVFRSFTRGMFSASTTCACNPLSGACASCAARSQARFVWENGYSRVSPYGDDHWYVGLSDAVDKDDDEYKWLQCCYSI